MAVNQAAAAATAIPIAWRASLQVNPDDKGAKESLEDGDNPLSYTKDMVKQGIEGGCTNRPVLCHRTVCKCVPVAHDNALRECVIESAIRYWVNRHRGGPSQSQ